MKAKKIAILLVVAAALLLLARLSGTRRHPRPAAQIGRPVLAGIDLNAVRAVEVRRGDDVLRVAHGGETWAVTNAYGYPADFAKLREKLIALKELKVGQVQRGLSLATGDTTRVVLQDAAGRTLAGLTLGGQRQRSSGGGYNYPEGRYVAADGDPAVCLVKESLDGWSAEPRDWLDTQLLSVQAADIAGIELTDPAGARVRLDRSSGSLALDGLDAEKEEFDTSRAYGLESALSYLRFNAVADPALDETATGIATGHQYRVTLKNGEIYTARVGLAPPGGSDRYLKLAAALQPATTNDAARAEQEKRIADLSGRLSPWTFLISSYSAENMTHGRAALVKPKPASTNDVAQTAEE